ncbi:hypothetical protein C8Q74DRAFT_917260 [Fomes fomentarius]|nr:hypothetical protein C8Q74DRAFT_917260 [Fomes fomentarius]
MSARPRVLAAFGNRSAPRRVPSQLLLVRGHGPKRLTADEASRRHPSHMPLLQTHRELEPAGTDLNKCHGSRRHEPSQHAPLRQASTSASTVAEPHGYSHSDLLADTFQPEHLPDVPCSHPPPPALPSVLPLLCILVQTLRILIYHTTVCHAMLFVASTLLCAPRLTIHHVAAPSSEPACTTRPTSLPSPAVAVPPRCRCTTQPTSPHRPPRPYHPPYLNLPTVRPPPRRRCTTHPASPYHPPARTTRPTSPPSPADASTRG